MLLVLTNFLQASAELAIVIKQAWELRRQLTVEQQLNVQQQKTIDMQQKVNNDQEKTLKALMRVNDQQNDQLSEHDKKLLSLEGT